jgi:hypothetical protein
LSVAERSLIFAGETGSQARIECAEIATRHSLLCRVGGLVGNHPDTNQDNLLHLVGALVGSSLATPYGGAV